MSAQKIELHGGPFFHEPPWPGLVTSNELVFAPDWMHGSNAHFSFGGMVASSEIAEAITNEKTARQLEEWLNFDIVSAYPEYQGSICLVGNYILNLTKRAICPTLRLGHRRQDHGQEGTRKIRNEDDGRAIRGQAWTSLRRRR